MKIIFSFFLFLLVSQNAFAQQFQGKINVVSQNGLHKISLSPEVRSAAQNNINHIRILDAKNKEVPYVIFNGATTDSTTESLNIISKKTIPNVATSVVILNENMVNLDHLTLKIANTDVDKKYNISGSNDNKEWFGLINNQLITDLNEAGKTSVDRIFSFPLNNYKYIKFNFIDKNSLPINVLEVGLEKTSSVINSTIELQNFEQKTTIDKKNKLTRIDISFKTPQIINGIKFNISTPHYFIRDAKIIVNKTRVYKKRQENYLEASSFFTLNSKSNNQFEINELFTKEFSIEINNEDNQELEINKITLLQYPVNILTDLKANENYTLKIDNQLDAPNYDLAKSGINFNQDFPKANINNVESIQKKEEQDSKKEFWQTPLFMWICIVIAIIIIGYFSIVMIKDMNKEN